MGIEENLISQSSNVLSEAYADIIQPSAKPVGTVLSLLPRTIRLSLRRWEKWVINGEESLMLTAEALHEKVAEIPEERQCEPDPYVAVPAIGQLSYCYDSDELRNMYANLLASSMDKKTRAGVHPGFVDIIKQLTPDEAKLLRALPREGYLAVINLIVKLPNDKGNRTVLRSFSTICDGICEYPENVCSYLENLCRLGLAEIPNDLHLTQDRFYEPLRESPFMQKLMSTPLNAGESYDIEKKALYITNYGLDFINCCVDDFLAEK